MEKSTVRFVVSGEKEPIIVLSKDGFFFKGEKVEDIHQVYERFNEWLALATVK